MLGKKFRDFQLTEQAERFVTRFNALMEGEVLADFETSFRGRNGDDIHLVFNALLLTDENGQFVAVSGTAYDNTKRKLAEDLQREMTETLKRQADELQQFNKLLEERVHERTVAFLRVIPVSNSWLNRVTP
jgi:PAS domain-containing protein